MYLFFYQSLKNDVPIFIHFFKVYLRSRLSFEVAILLKLYFKNWFSQFFFKSGLLSVVELITCGCDNTSECTKMNTKKKEKLVYGIPTDNAMFMYVNIKVQLWSVGGDDELWNNSICSSRWYASRSVCVFVMCSEKPLMLMVSWDLSWQRKKKTMI